MFNEDQYEAVLFLVMLSFAAGAALMTAVVIALGVCLS